MAPTELLNDHVPVDQDFSDVNRVVAADLVVSKAFVFGRISVFVETSAEFFSKGGKWTFFFLLKILLLLLLHHLLLLFLLTALYCFYCAFAAAAALLLLLAYCTFTASSLLRFYCFQLTALLLPLAYCTFTASS